MEEQREKLKREPAGSEADGEYARRKLKMRQLGTMRLLAELFNRDLLTPAIMKIVTAELLSRSRSATGLYDSDLIECLVQVRAPARPSLRVHRRAPRARALVAYAWGACMRTRAPRAGALGAGWCLLRAPLCVCVTECLVQARPPACSFPRVYRRLSARASSRAARAPSLL